jgi:hypothetical protein
VLPVQAPQVWPANYLSLNATLLKNYCLASVGRL